MRLDVGEDLQLRSLDCTWSCCVLSRSFQASSWLFIFRFVEFQSTIYWEEREGDYVWRKLLAEDWRIGKPLRQARAQLQLESAVVERGGGGLRGGCFALSGEDVANMEEARCEWQLPDNAERDDELRGSLPVSLVCTCRGLTGGRTGIGLCCEAASAAVGTDKAEEGRLGGGLLHASR